MNKTTQRAINAYVQTGVETAVPEADPHRLIQMLFEGALAAIADARIKLAADDIPGRGQAISKAIAIIEQGLQPSLDTEKGGELADRMNALYSYIISRLLHANLRAQDEGLNEATRLISELHAGWKAIGVLEGGENVRNAIPA
jgi:flagellar secretion chaperone FliS